MVARHPRPLTGPKSWLRTRRAPRWVRWCWRHRPFQGTEYHRTHPVFMAYVYATLALGAWTICTVGKIVI